MERTIGFIGVLILAAVLAFDAGYAQLIDYERLERRKTEKRSLFAQPPPAVSSMGEDVPEWIKETPAVTNQVEQRYDSNRDGKLQSFEVRIFLRDVLDTIDAKGGYTVNSDILKEYDINRDGIISVTEAKKIREDIAR